MTSSSQDRVKQYIAFTSKDLPVLYYFTGYSFVQHNPRKYEDLQGDLQFVNTLAMHTYM